MKRSAQPYANAQAGRNFGHNKNIQQVQQRPLVEVAVAKLSTASLADKSPKIRWAEWAPRQQPLRLQTGLPGSLPGGCPIGYIQVLTSVAYLSVRGIYHHFDTSNAVGILCDLYPHEDSTGSRVLHLKQRNLQFRLTVLHYTW